MYLLLVLYPSTSSSHPETSQLTVGGGALEEITFLLKAGWVLAGSQRVARSFSGGEVEERHGNSMGKVGVKEPGSTWETPRVWARQVKDCHLQAGAKM